MTQKIIEYLFLVSLCDFPGIFILLRCLSSKRKENSENNRHLSKIRTNVLGRQAKCPGAHEQRELAFCRGTLQGGSDDIQPQAWTCGDGQGLG